MNCKELNKYIGAFADGELDTSMNLRALEHLNFCESCARKVARIEKLRAGVRRVFEAETVPSGLESRVRARVDRMHSGRIAFGVRFRRWSVPLGVAAAVVFVWQMSWWLTPAGPGPEGLNGREVEARWVSAIRSRHDDCVRRLSMHESWDLLPTLGDIARLSDKLGGPVLAPDLSDSGFVLVDADMCGINGIPVVHLIYRHVEDHRMMSLFSLARLDTLESNHGLHIGDRDCFLCTQGGATVIAWHDVKASYLVCGDITPSEFRAKVWPSVERVG